MDKDKIKIVNVYRLVGSIDERRGGYLSTYLDSSIAHEKAPTAGWYGSPCKIETWKAIFDEESDKYFLLTEIEPKDVKDSFENSMYERLTEEFSQKEIDYLADNFKSILNRK